MMKKKILIVGCGDRDDTFSYLSKDINNRYSILIDKNEIKGEINLPNFISSVYYSENYLTPQILIKNIKPDVIVFFQIFDFYQIALAIATNKTKIQTFFLAHGALTDLLIYKSRSEDNLKTLTRSKWRLIFQRLPEIIKSRIFYYSTFLLISRNNFLNYLKLPWAIYRLSNAMALNLYHFSEMEMNGYILFNKHNYDLYNYLYNLESSKVYFSGIPFFDFLQEGKNNDYLIYLDHPYLEYGHFDWNNDHHKKIALMLEVFAEKNKIQVYIKLHPKSNINIWKNYNLSSSYLKIIQEGNYEQLYANTNMVLGFSSSMIPGFLSANKNVVLLGWHPIDKNIMGEDFSQMGLCHKSLEISDLNNKYEQWNNNNKARKKNKAYDIFIKKYNYPFDGKATERIIDIISSKSSLNK